MIQFRSFRNSDPPALAEIWRAQPPAAALIQPATPALFDELVFRSMTIASWYFWSMVK